MAETSKTTTPEHKPWWQSRTLWINAGVLALATAADNITMLQDVLPKNWYQWIAFGLPIVNGVLRIVTTTGVRL